MPAPVEKALGSVVFQAARAKGIKPVIGREVYVAPGSRLEKNRAAAAVLRYS